MSTEPDGRLPIGKFRAAPNSRATALRVGLATGFAVLLAAAGAVVFLLPAQLSNAPTGPVTAPAATPAAPPAASLSPTPPEAVSPRALTGPAAPTQDAARKEADDLLSDALRRLARLEAEGVRIWGVPMLGTGLADAEAALDRANALHDRQQYAQSAAGFREAIARFGALDASRAERFRLAMETGRAALDRLDPPAATAAFRIAAAIEPGNDEARAGLDRAGKLPGVLAALAAGKQREAAGDIDGALASYRGAAALDPASRPALDGIARVGAAVAERDYGQAVSDALARLDRKDFRGASAALKRARAIHPATPEVTDIARRLAAAAEVAALDGIRTGASALEAKEDWPGALALYRKALAIDPSAAFADSGRTRAEGMIALNERIDRYIAQPDRLQSPEPLADAKALVAQAGTAAGAGKTLLAKKAYLLTLIGAAEAPVPVVLSSDGKTDVQVYRIGRLGSFAVHRLDLRPGTYTIVGSRAGYRDVRVQLRVAPGTTQTSVTVACTEPIAQ